MKWNLGDWFVALHVNTAWIVSTWFLFAHPDPLNFATWATVSATVTGVYHWLLLKDAKTPDA